jgi:hypothetical protein
VKTPVTREQLEELATMLAERLDLATLEISMLFHKHSGKHISGPALDELRRKLSWAIALSAAAVIDKQNEKGAP